MQRPNGNKRKDFDTWAWPLKETVEPGSFVFVWKEFYGPHDQKHKHAPVTEGHFQVVSTIDTTVVFHIDGKEQRLSWYRVLAVPAVGELMLRKIGRDENCEVQHKRAEKEMYAKSIDGAQSKEEFVIDLLADHSNERGRWKFKVRWYEFDSTDNTWMPDEGLPRSSVRWLLIKKRKF